MCGTVGLFIGCAALSVCPRNLLAGEPRAEDEDYRSPFGGWHERASVRRAPRRRVEAPADGRQVFFAPELVPVARHPLVRELPEHIYSEILVQHLYRYLDFTAKLETVVVNRTVLGIAHGTIPVDVPREMRTDAAKIYCDEAFHALFSMELADEVEAATGLPPRHRGQPFFLHRLRTIQEGLPPDRRALAELLFVIVSETLISATLSDMPRAGEVVPAVTESIRDHASDEGRHHAYFAAYLRHLWGRLDPESRRWAGTIVPELIGAFLAPDIEGARLDLVALGVAEGDAAQIVAEVYEPAEVREQIRRIAHRTVRYFESLGALDEPQAADAFAAHGLAGR